MQNAIRLLLVGFLAIAAATSVFAGQAQKSAKKDDSPRGFLEGIFKRYTGPESKGIQIGTRPQLDRYFTASVAAQIDRDFAVAKRKNEVPELNGDPFVGAQDWEIKNVRVSISNETSAAANGTVTFNNAGKDQTVRYDLIRTAYGWRIDDIKWPQGSLRGIYRK